MLRGQLWKTCILSYRRHWGFLCLRWGMDIQPEENFSWMSRYERKLYSINVWIHILMEHVFRWFVNNFYNSNSDINECDTSISPSGKCGGNAICSNSPGGFSCACQPGFTGDPFVNCYGKCRNKNSEILVPFYIF